MVRISETPSPETGFDLETEPVVEAPPDPQPDPGSAGVAWPAPIRGNAPDLAGSPWLADAPDEAIDEPAPIVLEEAPDA